MKVKLLVLSIALLFKVIESFDEDSDEDDWIFRMQHVLSRSLSSLPGHQVKFDQLGIAGGAVVDVWLHQHCSLKNNSQGKVMECMSCFNRQYKNTSGIANCTKAYLPDDYHTCVNFDYVSYIMLFQLLSKYKFLFRTSTASPRKLNLQK